MKKELLKTGFLAGALLLASAVHAQLTEGGKPHSFEKFFKPTGLVPVVHLPAFDLDALLAEDAINDAEMTKPFRFGYNHYTHLDLYNSGTWTQLENGDRLWQLQVKSAGAVTMNLAFNDFFIPQGAKLFVYTPDHAHVIGAITSANNHESREEATDLLPGDEVVIEYFEPASVAGQGSLNLWRVTHGYRSVSPFMQRMQERSFGDAGGCQINVRCALGTGWENEIRSVACIVVGGSEACTGALVNNTANDGTPYFLTANHCYSAGTGSWVFRFNWQSATCSNPASNPSSNSITGATLRARNAGSDFCLLELNSTPPATYGVYYAGWSRSTTPTTTTTAIHHPSGDIKKISTGSGTTMGTMSGALCWDVGIWTQACTEPGSSGSPLFDANHRVIGQLYGGPSYCGATGANLKDYYGRFDVSWTGGGTSSTRLSNWLDPLGTSPTTLDGYDPNFVPPSFSNDAGISFVLEPVAALSTCNTSMDPLVIIKNFGSNPLTSATVNYQLDGGPVQTLPWTGTLATYGSANVYIPTISGLTIGAHTLTFYTSDPNGVADPNTANDQSVVNFTITAPSPTGTIPVTNGFEGTFPGTGFSITNGGAPTTWAQNNTEGGFGASAKSAYINNYNVNFSGDSDYLNTAYLDFTGLSSAPVLTFDVAYAPYNATYHDSLKVWVSSDCNTPTLVYSKGYTTLATAPAYTAGLFAPTNSQWRTEIIDLSAFNGMTNVRISFENKSGYGQALYIDNINVSVGLSVVAASTLEDNVQMYPNPAGTNITLNLPWAPHAYSITVANGLGQQVINTNAAGSTLNTNIDISSLNPGIYFVTIENNGQKTVKKLVKE